ncbi:B3 domain-containing transcription factor LEC2 [Cardamine amara subsp. amara]|uniref:B3 domain-containing transcription factor LEC2 n=1 Tax=Cardamine amara subsp. amara TaxID=228776 RepID=A0ABD1BNG5_CARAN
MDTFLPFSSSNVNSFQELSMDLDNNDPLFTTQDSLFTTNDSLFTTNDSLFTTMPTYDQPPQLFPPYSYPMEQSVVMNSQPFNSSEAFPQIPVAQTGSEFGSLVGNPGLRQERGGFFDPHMSTKMARINRKKAMIRSRNNSSPSSSPTESVESRRQVVLNIKNNLQTADKEELYRYFSFDNKKLRVLLVKHLKNSDVGSLGRIVLPKREAEVNLPELSDKEGIIVEMRDVDSMKSWSFKYKFWSNNKSRMYVLENTGEFVKNYGVETGDSLTIYEDQSKNLYFSISRKSSHKQNEVREDDSMELNLNHFEDITFDYVPNNEDDASIAMLLGNLNDNYPIPDNHYPIPDNHYTIPDNHYTIPGDLMGFPVELQDHQAASSLPPLDHVGSSADYVSLDDFVW